MRCGGRYVVAICRIITGFTALALLSCCLTLYGTKRAMLYHLRCMTLPTSVHDAVGTLLQI